MKIIDDFVIRCKWHKGEEMVGKSGSKSRCFETILNAQAEILDLSERLKVFEMNVVQLFAIINVVYLSIDE